jgi:hypothetical protein
MPYVEYQCLEKFSILDLEMFKSFECSVVDYLPVTCLLQSIATSRVSNLVLQDFLFACLLCFYRKWK